MTTRLTRLSQKRVKSSDPAYPSLQEQLDARNQGGTGGGYDMPLGGIPRSDMTDDVQAALQKAEAAYVVPPGGIPRADLEAAVQDSLTKADTAYQKPADGIAIGDLHESIQQIFMDYTGYYVMPDNGIPFVDMDLHVRNLLTLAETSYQKPAAGIPDSDLAATVQDSLAKADSAYQKPAGGIPVEDMVPGIMTDEDRQKIDLHMMDNTRHITDHRDLKSVGEYTHQQIDDKLKEYEQSIFQIHREVANARDTFASIGARIDSTIGRNTLYIVDDKEEWLKGTMTNLKVTDEGRIVFPYVPEPIILDVHDIKDGSAMKDENFLGGIVLSEETYFNRGQKPWQDGTNWGLRIGLRSVFYVYAPITGAYQFAMIFSGRVRMQVASQLIIDSTNYTDTYDQVSLGSFRGEVTLEGGRLYPVVVECYYDYTGDRGFGLYWRPPGQALDSLIPMEYLNRRGYDVDQGIYESDPIDLKDDSFSIWTLGLNRVEDRVPDDIIVAIATSDDGVNFGVWTEIEIDDRIPVTPARFVKVRLTVNRMFDHYTPLIKSFEFRYISSANDRYHNEMIEARSTYIDLKERFDKIESDIIALLDMRKDFDASLIHPEYFSSIRLAGIELNLMRAYYNQFAKEPDYTLLEDGWVDHFKTTNYIDIDKSSPFIFRNEEILQSAGVQVLDSDNDWMRFDRKGMDFAAGNLQLSIRNNKDGTAIPATIFDSRYYWSWTGHSLLGQVSGRNKILAQPFYTKSSTGSIKRLSLRQSDSYSYTNTHRIVVVPTKADGSPDMSQVIWSSGNFTINGDRVFDYDNIWIPVFPNTKYWIVVQYMGGNHNDAYSYWWESANNGNVNIRLRSDNPENAQLRHWYTASSNPTSASQWTVSSSYYLPIYIEETAEYEPEGTAEYIADYGQKVRFLSSDVTLVNNGNNGVVEARYSGSDDMVNWSPITPDITTVPYSRFLKIWVKMVRSTLNFGTPQIDRITIAHQAEKSYVISKAFTLRDTPTHAILLVDEPENQSIVYEISRDDGMTWTLAKPSEQTDLFQIRPGKKLRVRATFDGDHTAEAIRGWVVQGIYYRDINGQNIAALQEEYLAEEGQTIFNTYRPYPLGNNALEVYVNGIYQSLHKDYNEIDEHTIQFLEPLVGNDPTGEGADRVTFRVAAGVYDVHDAVLNRRIEALEDIYSETVLPHEVEYEYENGRLKRENYAGTIFHVVDYDYDTDGRMIRKTIQLGDRVTTHTFEYDPTTGLLTKKKVTVSEVTP